MLGVLGVEGETRRTRKVLPSVLKSSIRNPQSCAVQPVMPPLGEEGDKGDVTVRACRPANPEEHERSLDSWEQPYGWRAGSDCPSAGRRTR